MEEKTLVLHSSEPSSQSGQGPGASPPRPPRRRWVWLLLIVATASVLSYFFIFKSDENPAIALTDGRVVITDKGFFPETIKIKAGQTVTWINTDRTGHWVMADPYPTGDSLPGFDSTDGLGFNDTYVYRFDIPGKYTYHDQFRPYFFRGAVQVE